MSEGNVNYNYEQTKFPADEAPGASVFASDAAGNIFHTYSTFGRGLDILLGVYNFLDLVPKGRDEQGLNFPMAWVRHHDRYDQAYFADPTSTSSAPKKSDSSCCSGEHHS
jgi:predicted dithiol-disulfide oxidoreductase (DUF899 family)